LSANYKSPCIKVCQLHWGTGWCFGCGRTGLEITKWLAYSDAEREAVLAALPARLAAMGLPESGDKEAGKTRARAQRLSVSPTLTVKAHC